MILDRIRRIYPELTKSQRLLADYVVINYQQVAFQTASQLARLTQLNEATIVRFAQRLGYGGYPPFVEAIQAIVHEELGAPRGVEEIGSEPFLQALADQINLLQRTLSHITPDLARDAVSWLGKARRIVVVGQGVSASLARSLCFGLCALGCDAQNCDSDVTALALMLEKLTPDSLLVGVAVETDGLHTTRALTYARSKGVPAMVIASSPICPSTHVVDLALTCQSVTSGSVPSFGAVAALVDALVQALAADAGKQLAQRDQQLASIRRFLAQGE